MNDVGKNIAVIGAGVSGLGAASLLSRAGVRVSIFEKSRGVSGRAASRTNHGCRYDHGANYFTAEDAEVRHWIFEELDPEGLVEIAGDIVPFDASGAVGESDKARDAAAKYSYSDGISSLGKKMRDRFDLNITHSERIVGLQKGSGSNAWTLTNEDDGTHGEFDAVVVTSPLAQALPMIEEGDFDEDLQAALLNAFRDVRYYSQYSVVMNFAGERPLPKNAYALINTDRAHAIGWISNESFKDSHVPAGQSLYVVQMSPQWSAEREGIEQSAIAEEAYRHVAELLVGELPPPTWSDVQWWRFAHPQPGMTITPPPAAAEHGLYFAGDAFVGKGRVAGALKSGFATARDIINQWSGQ